jgi:hypothetical protein
MGELVIRFFIGGIIVSLFAMLGDVLRPKSFAGLFGAAPSIALATIGLTIHHNGVTFAALEARSMMLGAAAFFVYAASTGWLLSRYKIGPLVAALTLTPIWFCVSLGLWIIFEGNSLR